MKKYLIVLFLLFTISSYATETTISGTTNSADNWFYYGDTTNRGTDTRLTMVYPFTSNLWQKRIILKFNTSGISATDTVSSAIFHIYLDANECNGHTPELYVQQLCKTGWQENDSNTDDWDISAGKQWGSKQARTNSEPCTDNISDGSGDDYATTAVGSTTPVCTAWQCGGCDDRWLTYDITALVQDWVDGDKDWNGGLLIHGEDGSSDDLELHFYSSEFTGDTSLIPKLVVTHTGTAVTSTPKLMFF